MLIFAASDKYKKLGFYSILTAAVICLAYNSFSATWYSVSLHRRLGIQVKGYLPLAMAVIPALIFGLGLLTGRLSEPMAGNYAVIAGWLLLGLIGLKIMLESFKFHPEERVVLTDTWQTTLLLALAGSINAFFGGLALGLVNSSVLIPVAIMFVVSLMFTLAGILFGNVRGYKTAPARFGILAGSLIVFISIRMLF
ncbi:MAG: manganese efflux pump [Lentimicrobium sp.]|jgi:putative Mn2+ efflux pump MntP|nr:manganese efflux pump [Lentimicrobium sp.]